MPNHRVSAKIPQPTRHDPLINGEFKKFSDKFQSLSAPGAIAPEKLDVLFDRLYKYNYVEGHVYNTAFFGNISQDYLLTLATHENDLVFFDTNFVQFHGKLQLSNIRAYEKRPSMNSLYSTFAFEPLYYNCQE